MALKLRVIQFALQNNYDKIKPGKTRRTHLCSQSTRKLGFKREVGWITMEKNLPQP